MKKTKKPSSHTKAWFQKDPTKGCLDRISSNQTTLLTPNIKKLLFKSYPVSLLPTGVGTSSNPCSAIYHGSRPFSEVEIRNVASYLYRNRRNLIGYMDIHAYSQLWMTPWGYKKAYPKDYAEMVRT